MEITRGDTGRFKFRRLDERHRYEKTIYNAYIENGSFYLTDEQRRKAYDEYASVR